MTQRLDQMIVNDVNSNAPFPCEICGSIEHITLNCQVRSPFPKTLVKLTIFKTSTRDQPMILILVPIIRVEKITRISHIV